MSLQSTYQNCKDTLASNLTSQGVSASGTEGLTSLIDKVLDIPSGGATVDTLTLTTDKTILSQADSDTATLTVTAYGSNNDPVPNATIGLYKNNTYWDTLTTNNNGVATKTYTSTGAGDTIIQAVSSTVYTNITLEDCKDYISGETNQLTKFSSAIVLRGGTATLQYDSTNKYYTTNITNNGESFMPITSTTGLDDFTIEFDGYLPYISSSGHGSLTGLTMYYNNNNWARLGSKVSANEWGIKNNGSYTEADISDTSNPQSTWIHFKFTITNNSIHRQIYNSNTLIYGDTTSYSNSWFTSSTQYGLPLLYGTQWKTYFKNIKIKAI